MGSLLFALYCKSMELNVMGLSEKQINRHKILIYVTKSEIVNGVLWFEPLQLPGRKSLCVP